MAPQPMLPVHPDAEAPNSRPARHDFLRHFIYSTSPDAWNCVQASYLVWDKPSAGEASRTLPEVSSSESRKWQSEAVLRVSFTFPVHLRRSWKELRNQSAGYFRKSRFSSKVGLSPHGSTYFHISREGRNRSKTNILFLFSGMRKAFVVSAIGMRRAFHITTNTFGLHQSW